MKKTTLFIAIILFFANSIFAQQYIFKFKIDNPSELNILSKTISIDNYQNGEVTAYANQKEFEKFKDLGYNFELLPHPSEGKSITMATTVAEMANWDRYPTHDVYMQMMTDFATNYPDICRLETIGTSEEGRQIVVLTITDNPDVAEQEPEFYYTGQMHGDEIVSGILFIRLIDYLLTNYGADTRVTNLVNNYEIWINPMSNPDGTYAGGNQTMSGATRGNSNGVDLNRNFPSPTYENPSYQNQSEIQMQISFAAAHNFVMSANSHSGAECINYPWDSWLSSTKTHADHNWWDHVSHNYADQIDLNAPNSYMSGFDNGVTHGGDWYVVDGSRQDHMGYFQYCRELTLELSNDKMLDADLLPAHWTYNRDAMLGYIEECLYGINGTVKNIDGNPLNAKIEISAHDIDNSEVYTDPEIGDYYRPIAPGTYDVTYSSEGYLSQTHSITVSDWETTTIKDVVLLQAQDIILTGIVTDATNGNPIENAVISFPESSQTSVFTNASGEYSKTLPEGEYLIQVYKEGYSAFSQTYIVSATNNEINFSLSPSQAITFESGLPVGTTFDGEADWFLSTSEAYEGTQSVQSGVITHEQSSIMLLSAETQAGEVSFFHKVSSENGYDFLKFYIDNQIQGSWSGETSWEQATYSLSAGWHTFKWEYIKDDSETDGSDCAWVDFVEYPVAESSGFTVTFNVLDGANPVQDAQVSLSGYGTINTNESGIAQFANVPATPDPGLDYTVEATGYQSISGKIIIEGDETVPINLQATDTQEISLPMIKIYPNPTTESFVLDFSESLKEGKVQVFNTKGELIAEKDTSKGFVNINLTTFEAGIYFVKLIIDNEVFTKKIIKQ